LVTSESDGLHSNLQTIGKYRIVGTLGRGSMGVVYKAQDPEIGRIVAIKTLRKLTSNQFHDADSALERFKIEARSAGNLRHPNLITIFEVNIEGDIPYIVMDYVEGEGLDVILNRFHRLNPKVALYYLKQVAEGIDSAHSQGVIHRDIKPSNIVVDKNEHVYVLDFGVASINESFSESEREAKSEPVMGTPAYMSPEQILNKKPNFKSDLFSLAVVGFEFLTGTRPFTGKNFNEVLSSILNAKPVPITSLVDLPIALEVEFERALAKDRDQRFNCAIEMVEAFAKSLGMDRIEKPVLSQIPGQERGPGRKRKPSEWKSLARESTKIKPVEGDHSLLSKSPRVPLYSEEVEDQEEQKADIPQKTKKEPPVNPIPEQAISIPGALWAHVDKPIGSPTVDDLQRKKSSPIFVMGMLLSIVCIVLGIGVIFLVRDKLDDKPKVTVKSNTKTVSTADKTRAGVADKRQTTEDSVRTLAPIEIPDLVPVPDGKLVEEMDDKEVLSMLFNSDKMEMNPKDVIRALEIARERALPGLLAAAQKTLQNPEYVVRLHTIELLVKMKDPRSVPLLVATLDDHDPAVRKSTADALGTLGSRKALGYLTSRLSKEDVRTVRMSLKKSIEKINGYPLDY
jgi:eukaryotic-like serine/threonine-protein kinase